MEEKELQKEEIKTLEKKEEVKDSEKKEEVETPEGYYLATVPTNYEEVIALGKKEIKVKDLVVKMANALKKSGIMID